MSAPDRQKERAAIDRSLRRNRCSGCGTLPYDDDIFCSRCSRRLRAICPGCRAGGLHPVTYFCTRCGGSRKEEG